LFIGIKQADEAKQQNNKNGLPDKMKIHLVKIKKNNQPVQKKREEEKVADCETKKTINLVAATLTFWCPNDNYNDANWCHDDIASR